MKWNGQDIQVSKEELISLGQKGFDATYKTQQAAEIKRKYQPDIDLLEKIRGGDKEAFAQLSKQANIDPMDILDIEVGDVEQGRDKPTQPFMSPQVEQLIQEVEKDQELFGKMHQIETVLPRAVIDVMAQDAGTFYSIVDEVRSGDAEIVLPQVTARMATLPELDRSLIMNNPEQFKNFYLSVKQSLSQAQTKPEPEIKQEPKEKKNFNEVAVKKSGGNQRSGEPNLDSFNSDSTYQAILDRLDQQG